MCEFDTLTTQELLHATFAAQREAYKRYPEPLRLERLSDLIRSEMLTVLGVYARERQQWSNPGDVIDEDESIERMSTAAAIVGSRVAAQLANGEIEVKVVSANRPDLTEVLVLRVDEVFSAMNRMFPQGPAPERILMGELTAHPGWDQGWVVRRLTAVGALVSDPAANRNTACEFGGSWSGWGTAPGLELMLLRRDGSGFLDFSNGERQHFGALPPGEHLARGLYAPDTPTSDDDHYLKFDYWLELDDKASQKYWSVRSDPGSKSPFRSAESEE